MMKLLHCVQNTLAFEQGPDQEACASHLNKLCKALLSEPALLGRLLLNDLGGNVILDAAQGGLPYSGALQVHNIHSCPLFWPKT